MNETLGGVQQDSSMLDLKQAPSSVNGDEDIHDAV